MKTGQCPRAVRKPTWMLGIFSKERIGDKGLFFCCIIPALMFTAMCILLPESQKVHSRIGKVSEKGNMTDQSYKKIFM